MCVSFLVGEKKIIYSCPQLKSSDLNIYQMAA